MKRNYGEESTLFSYELNEASSNASYGLLSAAWWPIKYRQRIGKICEASGSKDVRQRESQSNSQGRKHFLQLIRIILQCGPESSSLPCQAIHSKK